MSMNPLPLVTCRCARRVMLAAVASLTVCASAVAGGRLGNATCDLAPAGATRPCRIFMGRGMVVPPSREDFFMRPPAVVRFVAGEHGTIEGLGTQTVSYGCATGNVTALAAYGYVFDRWSDGSMDNPRALSNVTADTDLVALFRAAASVSPSGAFEAKVETAAVPARGLWDLTGRYSTQVAGGQLTMDLVHDTKGKLSGLATYAPAEGVAVTMPIKGSAKGASGNISMKGTLKGSDPGKTVSVALALDLVVDTASLQLVGSLTGSVKSAEVTNPVREGVILAIPAPMDGTWALRFSLIQGPKAITGSAVLSLSNGMQFSYMVKGKTGAGGMAVLSLAGDPADPAAKGIKIKATITPQEGGWARIESLSAKAYGQAAVW